MTLHPTPTRVALLQAVAEGRVTEHSSILNAERWSQLDRGPGWGPRYRKVTAAVAELNRAAWVRIDDADSDFHYEARPWEITDAGRAVLEEAAKK